MSKCRRFIFKRFGKKVITARVKEQNEKKKNSKTILPLHLENLKQNIKILEKKTTEKMIIKFML